MPPPLAPGKARLLGGMRAKRRIFQRGVRSRQQGGQAFLHRHPHPALGDVLVDVPEDVAGILDLTPLDVRKSLLLGAAQTTRRFGDYLQTSGHGIEGAAVSCERLRGHARNEALSQQRIVLDCQPRQPFSPRLLTVRRHRPRLVRRFAGRVR